MSDYEQQAAAGEEQASYYKITASSSGHGRIIGVLRRIPAAAGLIEEAFAGNLRWSPAGGRFKAEQLIATTRKQAEAEIRLLNSEAAQS